MVEMEDLRARKRRPVVADDLENQPSSKEKQNRPGRSLKTKVLLSITGFVLVFIVYLAAARSPIDAREVHLPDSLPHFDGVLAPNKKLQDAVRLYEGKVIGAESLEMDKEGNIYTGLYDGRIVRLTQDGQVTEIARTGADIPGCGTYDAEPECGRPLGIRLNKDETRLIVCDAYKGLLSVDISTGQVETLISAKEGMEGHPFKFLNDLTITSDGTIYFTDSSWKWSRRDNRYLVIEGGGHGRIMKYNPATGEKKVLLAGLYFANGIEVSPDESHLVVCETSIARIIRFYIKGEKEGIYDLFNDNLPGLPDNIRRHSAGGYWIGFAGVRKWPLSMLDILAPYPTVRSILTKVISQETIVSILPKHGLVLHMDEYGDIIESLQDPSARTVPGVSEVLEDTKNGIIYMGSYDLDYITRLKVDLERKSHD